MKAVLMNDLILVVEDKNKDVVSLTLYNNTLKQHEIDKYFPKGVKFAIKQPYMKVLFSGNKALRNDNPDNIIIKFNNKQMFFHQLGSAAQLVKQKTVVVDRSEILQKANKCFEMGQFIKANVFYFQALDLMTSREIQGDILSNIVQCHMNLCLYEDALGFTKHALQIEKDHQKALMQNAICLAYLQRFEESLGVDGINCEDLNLFVATL